jgi:hypothetical protein
MTCLGIFSLWKQLSIRWYSIPPTSPPLSKGEDKSFKTPPDGSRPTAPTESVIAPDAGNATVLQYERLEYASQHELPKILALIRTSHGANAFQLWTWEDFKDMKGAKAAVKKRGEKWPDFVNKATHPC